MENAHLETLPAVKDQSAYRLSSLDGLRWLAAIAVAWFHSSELFGINLPSSYLAVDFFFMLSGLVLARAYRDRLSHGMTVWEFMQKRFIRLYPLYALGTLLVAAYFYVEAVLRPGETIPNLSFALSFALVYLPTPPGILATKKAAFPFLFPAWSLFFELIANIAYAAFHSKLTRTVLRGAVAIGAIAVLAAAIFYGNLDVGAGLRTFPGGFIRVAFSFFAGVLLQSIDLKWKGGTAHALLCAVALLATLVVPISEPSRPVFDTIAVIAIFPMIALVAAHSEATGRLRSMFIWLGDASYGIYTLHIGLLLWLSFIALNVFGFRLSEWAPFSGLLFLAAVTALATILDAKFDRPVRSVLQRVLDTRVIRFRRA